jgi:GTP-binding protein LepA
MNYEAGDGRQYELNLIDTPGHVDFSYEVSRSMSACEGAILVVDAAQGVQAQTVANTHLAVGRGLAIIPVINKIDLPNANIESAKRQIEDVLAIDASEALLVSAKTGAGIDALLEAVVSRVPMPKSTQDSARALIFDSMYDAFKGVVTYVRVVDGTIRVRDRIHMLGTGTRTEIKEIGIFSPKPRPVPQLNPGQVGYLVGTIKTPAESQVGDTIIMSNDESSQALSGFKPIKPMVFSGLYPVDTAEYEKFRQSLEKLSLNDSALTFHAESSVALGFGFRCGFLGLLHMEIVQERLTREFDLEIIGTAPSVIYRIDLRNGQSIEIDNPIFMPDVTTIETIYEPFIRAFIICMNENIGDVMKLIMDRRGDVVKTESLDTTRVMLTCNMPLNEILTDFHDLLKSVSHGYASMDYEHSGYVASDMVKLDVMLNGEVIDAFSSLVHRSKAVARGRQVCAALKDSVPRHMFAIPVQAAIGKNIVARETIRAFRKDVTAKLYGGDVTRKRKLLDKQKQGKKRMKQFGQVSVPQKAFISVLKTGA